MTSLTLGILSSGLFILACLSLIWIKLAHFGEYQAILYVYSAFLILLVSLILGIPGCIVAIIGLARIRKQGSDNKTLRTAILGLVLGGVGPAFILFYLTFGLLFDSSTPPPVMITPSSMIP
jgi:uncharacterized membrane protein